ncbi:hypothetical protein CFC21_062475, partial [Triticum aestivum]
GEAPLLPPVAAGRRPSYSRRGWGVHRRQHRHGHVIGAGCHADHDAAPLAEHPAHPPLRRRPGDAVGARQHRHPRHHLRPQRAAPRHRQLQRHGGQVGGAQRGRPLPVREHHGHRGRLRGALHAPQRRPLIMPAMRYLQNALVAAALDKYIKISTPHSSSIILDSFPPSQAFFNRSLDPVLVPMLKFLQSTGAPLMLNVYPYYDYMRSNGVIPLDYALFRPLPPNKEAVDANTLLHYTNVFDAVVDAAYFAMAYLNVTNVPVMVTETGWPHKGDASAEPDANNDNADTYNSNLIRHVMNVTGTPKHPGVAVPTFIYELYDEDTRPGTASEKYWGLFDMNGIPAYALHLTGSGVLLANDTTNQTYCVAREGADEKMLQAALDWACGPGKVDCSVLTQGKPCYDPDTVEDHATYAFNAYYHGMGMGSGTCYFSGVAVITTTDPSKLNSLPCSNFIACSFAFLDSCRGNVSLLVQAMDLVSIVGRTAARC